MAWSNTNTIHACLYTFEAWYCMQKSATFEEVGDWNTTYVIRLGGGSTGEFSSNSAIAHALKVDEIMTDFFRMAYKNGSKSSTAIEAMAAILEDDSKTVADLGAEMENHYDG